MAKKKSEYDYLNDALNGDDSGFEDINMQTMSVPFIRLLQDLSPQLKPSKPEYIEGAKSGQFVNTVSGKLYDAPIKIVVGKFERLYLEWGTSRGKLMGVHTPENVEVNLASKLVRNDKNQLMDPDTQHTFQDTYTYYVVLPEHMEEGICILTLASTGIKEAKKLNRNMLHTLLPGTSTRALPYFMVWNVEVIPMTNDQGDWWGMKFSFDSFVQPDVLAHVREERKELPNKHVDYAQLEYQEEDTEADARY